MTLSRFWIEILDASPENWATGCLADNAIDHPFAEVRTAAADALRNRPQENYVPRLARRLGYPVELSVSLLPHADGVSYVKRYYREGEEADEVDTINHSEYLQAQPLLPGVTTRSGMSAAAGAKSRLRLYVRATSDAAETYQEVAHRNAPTLERNRRIQNALARATGHDREPQYWRERLDDYERSKRQETYDHYELEQPREEDSRTPKPVVSQYHRSPPPSCFPHGTQVSTLVGLLPIEKIQVGDFVLSQDPGSGELAYKPVLEITTRSPAPMIRIGLGEESITATRGHPFWVPGGGWKMAKEMEVGARLHTAAGAATVESLEPLPDLEPWHDLPLNLVVADFHTYFVGSQKVLVHDNLLFADDPTAALVPGLPPSEAPSQTQGK